MRTFLALDIDEKLRGVLTEAVGQIDTGPARVRWVLPENLHVTMNFLGEVADDAISDICAAVAEAARGVQPFDFNVRRIVCVPPAGHVRMFWAAVEDPTGRMDTLYELLAGAASAFGITSDDRKFNPHITLGRIKSAGDTELLRRQAADLPAPVAGQHAGEVIIYTSRLTPNGPIYTPVARAAIGK